MSFLPKNYKALSIKKSKFFVTTKIFSTKKAPCPRCGRDHPLESGEFINNHIVWDYVVCKNNRSYLIIK